MTQKVKYNETELLATIESWVDGGGWKYILFYGFIEKRNWLGKITKDKTLVYSTKWINRDFKINNQLDFQKHIPKALGLMEKWFKEHEEAGKKIVMEIKTKESFLK